ncbi:MAG: O-acetylhomoserine aminocarboxypropyltransferase/cysteine synthase family protein [Bacillota bacterium]
MQGFETKCVQSGYKPKNGEPRVMPIVQSTTFLYETAEEMGELFDLKREGFFYTRLGNPTNDCLEQKMAILDGGTAAVVTASGMSATMMAVLTLAGAGDNIVSMSTIYGGTYNLFKNTFKKLDIECRFFTPTTSEADIEALIDDNTRVIFCETIANPAITIADFEMLSRIAKKYGIVLMSDNTLATPAICRPKEHGVNVVVYSSSKYLDGHATCVGGVVVDCGNFEYSGNKRYPLFNEPDESYHGLVFARDCGNVCFAVRLRVINMRDMGAQMAPMNAWLTNLGTETLSLRMERHSSNALALAAALEKHPNVEWVNYAGLPTNANYPLVQKYFDKNQATGMIAFGIKGGRDAAMLFQKQLKLFAIVTHIADTRSCVLHPASTTHRQLSDADLEACGISTNLIRLSVGIESVEDIIADIINALDNSGK